MKINVIVAHCILFACGFENIDHFALAYLRRYFSQSCPTMYQLQEQKAYISDGGTQGVICESGTIAYCRSPSKLMTNQLSPCASV